MTDVSVVVPVYGNAATLEALHDRLAAEGREHVLRFDWADVARSTASLYEDLEGVRL